MLITAALDLFLLFKSAENLSTGTVVWYRDVFKNFLEWLDDGQRQVHELTAVDITKYLARERARKLAPSTIHGRYRALQSFLNWCEDSDEVGNPPSPIGHGRRKKVKPPKVPDTVIRHIKEYERDQLLSSIDLATWIDYRDWCIINILYWTGLRRAELCALTIDDIDFLESTIQVEHGKGDKPRTLPIIEDVLAGVKTYLAMRPPWKGRELWLAWDAFRRGVEGKLSHAGLRQMLVRRCKRAGIRYTNAHLFRHTFATNLLNGGADMDVVREILGHTDVRTTRRKYAKYQISGLRRSYNQAVARIRVSWKGRAS